MINNIEQYYRILGLSINANEKEVKQAYRKLAKIWHPDSFHNDPIQQQKAETKFKVIVEAYEIIKTNLDQYEIIDQPSSNIYTQKSSPDIHYQMGTLYAENEQYQEAIAEFSKAIRLDENYLKAYQYRGFILSKLGYKNRADADFKKANKLKKIEQPFSTNHVDPVDKKEVKQENYNQTKNTNTQPNLTQKWQIRYKLKNHHHPIYLVSLSFDCKLLATVSKTNSIDLWDLPTGNKIKILSQHKSLIRCLKFTSNNQYLLSSSEDKQIIIWDLYNCESKVLGDWKSGHNQAILSFDISPDGKFLVSGSADKTIKIWSLNYPREPYTLTGYKQEILAVAVSPDGDFFVSGGMEKKLTIRQLCDGKIVNSLIIDSGVTSVIFSPNSELLATGGFDGIIRIWCWKKGEEVGLFKGHLKHISRLTFSQDGQNLITLGHQGQVKFWSLNTWQEMIYDNADFHNVLSFDISSNGKTLVTSYSDKYNYLQVFDLKE